MQDIYQRPISPEMVRVGYIKGIIGHARARSRILIRRAVKIKGRLFQASPGKRYGIKSGRPGTFKPIKPKAG